MRRMGSFSPARRALPWTSPNGRSCLGLCLTLTLHYSKKVDQVQASQQQSQVPRTVALLHKDLPVCARDLRS